MGSPLFTGYRKTENAGILQSRFHGECYARRLSGQPWLFRTWQVVALCGDGGLSMLLGDLSTIVQYHLPIKIIVFNNRAVGNGKIGDGGGRATGLAD